MKRKYLLLGLFFVLLSLPTNAFAAESPKGQLSLRLLEKKGSGFRALVSARGIAANDIRLTDLSTNRKISTHSEPAAVDLWLLLDTSAFCAKYSMDQVTLQWLNKLARLSKESRISLLTFHRGSLEALVLQQSPSSLKIPSFRCRGDAVSSDPNRALERVLENSMEPGLSRAVWVLSSGNVTVSPENLKNLKRTSTELAFLVYNPVMGTVVQPLFEEQKSFLGNGLFFGGTPTHLDSLPISYTTLTSRSGAEKMVVVASTGAGETRLVSNSIEIAASGEQGGALVNGLLALLTMAFLVWMGVRIFRYYRPRYCQDCQHRLRYRDPCCAFCFSTEGAYLVSEHPLESQSAFFPLVTQIEKQLVVGTHRRSSIRCLRAKGERRTLLFSITKNLITSGDAYLLTAHAPVLVNGKTVHSERYLASGDRIQAGHNESVFYSAKRERKNAQ